MAEIIQEFRLVSILLWSATIPDVCRDAVSVCRNQLGEQ